jgi:arsenite methyltransferase
MKMTNDPETVRDTVRMGYGKIAKSGSSCCGATRCDGDALAQTVGYSEQELAALPEGANMGLSCGNPTAIASLREGEVILDLGSGGGFDVFIASRKVGPTGHVIGVDMTPEMIRRARDDAVKAGFANVEFRLGQIEHLPVADESVDVILSNCVINLSPEKAQVYREAFRVLRPSGRLAVSDVVATAELPAAMRDDPALYAGCVAGAEHADVLEAMLRGAGFTAIRIRPKAESRDFIRDWAPGQGVEDYVVSASIEAVKPSGL